MIRDNIIYGGKAFYGQPIGILMMDAIVPRMPGDIGNGFTFDFPVRYKVVKGASVKRIIKSTDPTLSEPLLNAAKELEEEGVKAITTSCGYIAWFQKEMANAVSIPVFTSSLIQLPMVSRMLSSDQKVGILTADSRTLTLEHLKAIGIDSNIPIVVKGSENTPEFYNTFPTNGDKLDYYACRDGVVKMVSDLLEDHSEVGAIVCEGSNFALFRSFVQEATGIPFFDIVTLTRMVYQAVVPVDLPKGCM